MRVEHQLGRILPGLLVPELDEPPDLVSLVGLGYSGMGVAEDAMAGITGQERQDALLAPASPRDGVLLQRFLLGIGRDGVDGRGFGPEGLGALFVEPPREAREALLTKQ